MLVAQRRGASYPRPAALRGEPGAKGDKAPGTSGKAQRWDLRAGVFGGNGTILSYNGVNGGMPLNSGFPDSPGDLNT